MKEDRQKENVKDFFEGDDVVEKWYKSQKQLMLVILTMTQESFLSNTNPIQKARLMRKAMGIEGSSVNMIRQHMEAQQELMTMILKMFLEIKKLKQKLEDVEDSDSKSV